MPEVDGDDTSRVADTEVPGPAMLDIMGHMSTAMHRQDWLARLAAKPVPCWRPGFARLTSKML